MPRIQKKYSAIRYISDAPVIILVYLIVLKFFPGHQIVRSFTSNFIFILLTLIIWYFTANISNLYKDRRSNKFSEEIIFIIYTVMLFTILLSSVFFFLGNYLTYNSDFILPFLSLLTIFIITAKYIIRKTMHSALFQGKLYDSILLVGATPAAMQLYDAINKYYYYGYKCVGFLDNETVKLNGCHYAGHIENLHTVLAKTPVDEVVIALPNSKHKLIRQCIEVCDHHSTSVKILPDFHQYASSASNINNIGLVPVINFNSLPLDKLENKLLKRAFDIGFAFLFFILLGIWLLPLIAILIKLTSKGKVIFKQERWGLNNKKIICYKFRSMVADCANEDQNGNFVQTTKNDARVTPLGKILRKTNMDELPQFWNVLLGNMSVVGPRPHPTPLNIQSIQTVDNYMLRHKVLPGITGWAQVNGSRGETKTPEVMQYRVNFDLYYIHRWTFWLDCQIILQTIINIFRGDQNAY